VSVSARARGPTKDDPIVQVFVVNRFFWPDHGATSQLALDLARDLVARGHGVTAVASRQRYDDPDAALPVRETVAGVRVHRVATTRRGRHWLPGRALDYATFYLAATLALWRLVRAGDVVLAKTDPPLLSVVAGWVARRRGARLVTWQQDLFPEVAAALGMRWAASPLGRALVWLRNHSLRRASCNVVLDDAMADRLRDEGVGDNLCVIPNWSDADLRPIPHAANPLRREWSLEGACVVGYSGNLGRAHLAGEVAELVAVTADLDELRWLFVGAGAGIAQVRARTRAEADARVRFRPYQPRERLSQSLSAPDVHLVSLDPACEGLIVPSKFYGVLAVGRPVVFLGDAEGVIAREIRRFDLGVVLAADRPETWRPALAALVADAAERAAMGARARARFDAVYRSERALDRWARALDAGTAAPASAPAAAPARAA
jgi:glycosyltransferase involved in cell wall biosynthesis